MRRHFAVLQSRHFDGVHFEGKTAIDIDKSEFLCPLCKRLSNLIVPDLRISPVDRALADQAPYDLSIIS